MLFKDYQIIEKIGEGGMAEAYLARSKGSNLVVLKVLRKNEYSKQELTRFKEEARQLQTLNHANVVNILDFVNTEESYAIVMEYLEGGDLKSFIDEHKPLSNGQIENYFNQIKGALEYIHSQGIVHRDIKPSNFIFDKNGVVKLTDFGIAKDTCLENGTITLEALGTPGYMSPEQVFENEVITSKSDYYSLGVVLWEMVSGKKLLDDSTSVYEKYNKIVNKRLPKTGTIWDGLILNLTYKDPDKRNLKIKNVRNTNLALVITLIFLLLTTAAVYVFYSTKNITNDESTGTQSPRDPNSKSVCMKQDQISKLYGLYDKMNHKYLTEIKFNNVKSFTNGKAAVRVEQKWGYISENGDLLIDYRFNWAQNFFIPNVAAVSLGEGRYGCIDNNGKIIIPLKYEDVGLIHNDKAQVKENDRWIWIYYN